MSGAFRTPTGGRIDRSKTVEIRFDGKPLTGYAGDTVAAIAIDEPDLHAILGAKRFENDVAQRAGLPGNKQGHGLADGDDIENG